MKQELLKVQDAAAKLGVSKSHLYKLPKNAQGVYRFGKAVRYDIEELRAWGRGKNA